MRQSGRNGRTVSLPSGEQVPALGLGSWHMGDDPARRSEEIATLRLALDLGVTLIDTAEMYGEGAAEELIGEALGDRRDEAFLVSKVYPHNASRDGVPAACERSLRRLRTDRLDLYLLHWPGGVPLEETVEAFEALRRAGKIRHWGVSNFDLAEMEALWAVPGGEAAATDQILYNLARRGPEWDLLPGLARRRVPAMAYSPLEQTRLLRKPALMDFASRHGMTPAQAALAWLLARKDVISIPKTASRERLRENVAALELALSDEQLAELDRLFPPPTRPSPLAML
ncbi:MAG: aldo/keto reductase [Tistlia sp.]|uniref:aldo/keto reductase n=1 Tax=Tistlia sp. TaxID=3057121 RepID=UPI0034A2DBD3